MEKCNICQEMKKVNKLTKDENKIFIICTNCYYNKSNDRYISVLANETTIGRNLNIEWETPNAKDIFIRSYIKAFLNWEDI